MRLFWAREQSELVQVVFGFVRQSLFLGNGKVGPRVIGKERSRLPGRATVSKVRVEER